jgi:hypothetical protein
MVIFFLTFVGRHPNMDTRPDIHDLDLKKIPELFYILTLT